MILAKAMCSTKAVRTQLIFAIIVCLITLGVGYTSASEQQALAKADNVVQQLYLPPSCDTTCQADGTYNAMNWAAKKYGFPRWFIYATVHRESSFRPGATNGSGTGNCDVGYGLTQLTCRAHTGVIYPENLSAPDQSHTQWQWDMQIPTFCTQTGLCPYINMHNVTALRSGEWSNPYRNLDRYFSGYAAPAFYLEKARAPQGPGETNTDFHNRVLRRVAHYWRYGYGGPQYPNDPSAYFQGSSTYPYNWDTYVGTYRPAVESEDGIWDGNVCRPPYSDTGCAAAPNPTYTTSASISHPCLLSGETASITTTFTNTNNTAYDGRVAIQLFDARTPPAVARSDALRTIPANGSTSFTFNYTAQAVATAWKEYDIGVGVFAPNPQWDPNLYWGWVPQKITVSEDNKPYNFECARTQNWTFNPGGIVSAVASTTTRAYSGRSSLAVDLAGAAAGTRSVWSNTNPKPAAGQTVQFRVYIPTGSAISTVQAFVKEGASGNWKWTGNYRSISQLIAGSWNSIPVTIPTDAQPLDSLGVEFTTNAAWTGTAYVDAVEWQ